MKRQSTQPETLLPPTLGVSDIKKFEIKVNFWKYWSIGILYMLEMV